MEIVVQENERMHNALKETVADVAGAERKIEKLN